MKTKLLGALGSALLMLGASAPAAAADTLRIGISAEPYPPFTYKSSDGSWTGFEVELSEAICARIEHDCKITPTSWSGIIPALNSNKIDLIMTSMSITEKRDKVIDFTDPYYYTLGAYVAEKGMSVNPPDDLAGKILGVQAATTHASYARQELQDIASSISTYNKQEQVNRDLMAGRVDVMLADQIAMAEFVERDEASNYEIKGMTPKHPAFGDGIGIGVRDGDTELRKTLNTAIGEVLNDGTCTQLSQKYFNQDICGG
ncbi:MAG: transporter substrate-binding domain-containing protein [Halofilum sp. (in: g-proteobacteria)]